MQRGPPPRLESVANTPGSHKAPRSPAWARPFRPRPFLLAGDLRSPQRSAETPEGEKRAAGHPPASPALGCGAEQRATQACLRAAARREILRWKRQTKNRTKTNGQTDKGTHTGFLHEAASHDGASPGGFSVRASLSGRGPSSRAAVSRHRLFHERGAGSARACQRLNSSALAQSHSLPREIRLDGSLGRKTISWSDFL